MKHDLPKVIYDALLFLKGIDANETELDRHNIFLMGSSCFDRITDCPILTHKFLNWLEKMEADLGDDWREPIEVKKTIS